VVRERESIPPNPGLTLALRVGDCSHSLETGGIPLGVRLSASAVGVGLLASLEGVDAVVVVLVGEEVGVDCLNGDVGNGDSGRRKGDVRGDP
jgi:hypothetical protein